MSNGKPKWYYDACTLERGRPAFLTLFTPGIEPVTSHLAIGEACSNALLKGKEQAEAFIELIGSLSSILSIVSNDGVEHELGRVRARFEKLSITDAMHIAMSFKLKCCRLYSDDRDQWGLNTSELKQLAIDLGCPEYEIKHLPFPKQKRR